MLKYGGSLEEELDHRAAGPSLLARSMVSIGGHSLFQIGACRQRDELHLVRNMLDALLHAPLFPAFTGCRS